MRNSLSCLTAKQSRFIDEYMIDLNGAAAAVRCGYSPKTSRAIACELLTKPDIQAELQARQAADAVRLSITREVVLNGLQEAINQARVQGNPGAMISGWREIAKMLGLMAPEVKKVELSASGQDYLKRIQQMPDAELLAQIARGAAAA